jgi:hypothetical protein
MNRREHDSFTPWRLWPDAPPINATSFSETLDGGQAFRWNRIEDYYEGREDEFVSEYSVPSPDEDMAESMLYFFTKPRKLDESIEKNRKINSFYKFPEMIDIRNYIQRSSGSKHTVSYTIFL